MVRHALRVALAAIAGVGLLAGTMSPAAAVNGGAGVIDGEYVTDPGAGYPDMPEVTYRVLYLYGRLDVGGEVYDGGFAIAGMSAVMEPFGGGTMCFTCVTRATWWRGVAPGVVRGFDPTPASVAGECRIDLELHTMTGPAFIVEAQRHLDLACTLSVRGGPATPVSLDVTVEAAGGFVAGAYTVT